MAAQLKDQAQAQARAQARGQARAQARAQARDPARAPGSLLLAAKLIDAQPFTAALQSCTKHCVLLSCQFGAHERMLVGRMLVAMSANTKNELEGHGFESRYRQGFSPFFISVKYHCAVFSLCFIDIMREIVTM